MEPRSPGTPGLKDEVKQPMDDAMSQVKREDSLEVRRA
jgi:hypothetical protein